MVSHHHVSTHRGRVLWILVVAVVSTGVVNSYSLRRREETFRTRYQEQETASTYTAEIRPTYDRHGLDGPCSKAECPVPQREVALPHLQAVLRKYSPSDWIYVRGDRWKFTHTTATEFMDAMSKIIDYQRGEMSYLGKRLPISMPILVEVNTTGLWSDEHVVEYRRGVDIYYHIPASFQDDPYAAPTDKSMGLALFTPHHSEDWVAVHQWAPDPFEANKAEGKKPDYDLQRQEIGQHITWFSHHISRALVDAGLSG